MVVWIHHKFYGCIKTVLTCPNIISHKNITHICDPISTWLHINVRLSRNIHAISRLHVCIHVLSSTRWIPEGVCHSVNIQIQSQVVIALITCMWIRCNIALLTVFPICRNISQTLCVLLKYHSFDQNVVKDNIDSTYSNNSTNLYTPGVYTM